MVYKRLVLISLSVAIVACIISNVTFAAVDVATNDAIYDSVLQILVFIQKYSWPVVTLGLIYALYEFYVIGSEMVERKIAGQKLINGIAVFMAIIQCLPLIYVFIVIGTKA